MTDSITDQMYAAAVTQAEQAAVAAMNRDAEFARHTAQAMDLVAGPLAERELEPPHGKPTPPPPPLNDNKSLGEYGDFR